MSVLMPVVRVGVELVELLLGGARPGCRCRPAAGSSPRRRRCPRCPSVGMASVRLTLASATRPRYQPQPLAASRATVTSPPPRGPRSPARVPPDRPVRPGPSRRPAVVVPAAARARGCAAAVAQSGVQARGQRWPLLLVASSNVLTGLPHLGPAGTNESGRARPAAESARRYDSFRHKSGTLQASL